MKTITFVRTDLMHSYPAGVEENSVDSEKDLLSIGQECEEWPVQKV